MYTHPINYASYVRQDLIEKAGRGIYRLGFNGRSPRHSLGMVHALAGLGQCVHGCVSSTQYDPEKDFTKKKPRKIAVLMTDGEYNLHYASGQGDSTAQARELCTNMKKEGIEIFSIGFMLNAAAARDTMRHCATDPDHVFFAENGTQMMEAFRAIAYKIVPIHLKK